MPCTVRTSLRQKAASEEDSSDNTFYFKQLSRRDKIRPCNKCRRGDGENKNGSFLKSAYRRLWLLICPREPFIECLTGDSQIGGSQTLIVISKSQRLGDKKILCFLESRKLFGKRAHLTRAFYLGKRNGGTKITAYRRHY